LVKKSSRDGQAYNKDFEKGTDAYRYNIATRI
jgi:hypothetical protein